MKDLSFNVYERKDNLIYERSYMKEKVTRTPFPLVCMSFIFFTPYAIQLNCV